MAREFNTNLKKLTAEQQNNLEAEVHRRYGFNSETKVCYSLI